MTFSRELKIGLIGIVALVLLFFTIKFLQGVTLFSEDNIIGVVSREESNALQELDGEEEQDESYDSDQSDFQFA